MAPLGRTDLDVFPLCLGGNVFGWTADEAQSFAVLDAYAAAGGNFVDTANSYLVEHGRSETIIGRWMAERGNRDEIVLATKVGGGRGAVRSLRPETIEREAQASLERLQTDRIDLYYAHFDDEDDAARGDAARVRRARAGGHGAPPRRLQLHARAADRGARAPARARARRVHGPAAALQPRRARLRAHAAAGRRGVGPRRPARTTALAKGFLTGKYRPGRRRPSSPPRAEGARAYLDARRRGGARRRSTRSPRRTGRTVAAVALAWLRAQPRVVAPIASARTTEQLEQILPAATLELTPEEVDRLAAAATAAA